MNRTLALTVIVAFSAFVLCTVGLFATHADHAMGACPFASQMITLCTPETTGRLAALLPMATALMIIAAVVSTMTEDGPYVARASGTIPTITDLPPQPLRLAFSDGTIQPKVFRN